MEWGIWWRWSSRLEPTTAQTPKPTPAMIVNTKRCHPLCLEYHSIRMEPRSDGACWKWMSCNLMVKCLAGLWCYAFNCWFIWIWTSLSSSLARMSVKLWTERLVPLFFLSFSSFSSIRHSKAFLFTRWMRFDMRFALTHLSRRLSLNAMPYIF